MTSGRALWTWSGPPRVDVLRLRDGAAGDRYRVAIRTQDGIPGVVIIAEQNDRIALVRQHRPAVELTLWELPRGFGEADDRSDVVDEQATTAAARELREETGLEMTEGQLLGPLYPDSGLLINTVLVVQGNAHGDLTADHSEGEVDSAAWFDEHEVEEMIARGEIADGISLGALALRRAKGSAQCHREH